MQLIRNPVNGRAWISLWELNLDPKELPNQQVCLTEGKGITKTLPATILY